MDSALKESPLRPQDPSQGLEAYARRFTFKDATVNGLFAVYKGLVGPALLAFGGAGYGCRYSVTCSEYARQAFRRKPWPHALKLSLLRVLHCNPWSAPRPEYQDI